MGALAALLLTGCSVPERASAPAPAPEPVVQAAPTSMSQSDLEEKAEELKALVRNMASDNTILQAMAAEGDDEGACFYGRSMIKTLGEARSIIDTMPAEAQERAAAGMHQAETAAVELDSYCDARGF